jgi:hypothetical protein
MMFLCGLDGDGSPTAINIANCQCISIVLIGDSDGEMLMVEWSDSDVSRTVQARGATTCGAEMLIPLLDHFSAKASKRC